MRRRTVLGLGGLAVATAGAGTAWECRVPDDAVAAWRAAPTEREAMHFALAHALLAPNPHNMQPWRVSLPQPGFAVLRLDPTRLLPETDPAGRQILMGTGAFLELFRMAAAARGMRAEIALFPEGEPGATSLDARAVARIGMVTEGPVTPDPLFAQALARRTDRRAYDPARVPDAAAAGRLKEAASLLPRDRLLADPTARLMEALGAGGRVEVISAPDRVAELRAIAREAWRIELTTAGPWRESMRVLRAGASEIVRHRDGIVLTDPLPVIMARLGLLDRAAPPVADSFAVRSQIEWFDRLTASTPAYLSITTSGNGRRAQIIAGQVYMRIALAAAEMGLALHPNEQALQEYPEVAGSYRDIHTALARRGETVQMFARIGWLPAGTPPLAPAPRRGLDALLEPLDALA